MWDWLRRLEELRASGQAGVLVTLVGSLGSTPREIGARMLVRADGSFEGTIGGGHLLSEVSPPAQVIKYPLGAKTGQCCGGVVELMFEALNAGPRLYLFGAGHVGQAVCRTLAGTPFQVHVIDEREDWVRSEAIPAGTIRHHCEWDEFAREAPWHRERTYVAVMTHRHDLDQAIIEDVVKRDARYIGLIGSRSKWARFRQRLGLKGVSDEALERVRCPIGLPIGGKAPQEVAISLASELLQRHYSREPEAGSRGGQAGR
jgi:xanthine dehydrogenase accessory factor